MKKILELNKKQFMRGMARSGYFTEDTGIWAGSARGINPFMKPERANVNTGVLQTSVAPIDSTSTVVVDTPMAWVNDVDVSSNYAMFFLGSSGHFYKQILTSPTAAPTDLRSGTPITDPANGIAVYQPFGGTKLLYYWQKTQIGTWDLSGTYPTGWDDNGSAYTGLQSTIHHPNHRFAGAVYYGNKDRVGRLIDDGASGVSFSLNVLDIPSDELITTLWDDGTYLVIGSTPNLTTSGTQQFNTLLGARIRFWNLQDPSWTREWEIKDAVNILSIRRVGSMLYALASNGLWEFTFSSEPKRVLWLSSSDAPVLSTTVGSHYCMDTYGDGVIWADAAGALQFYGSPMPGHPKIYYQPFTGASGNIRMVSANANTDYIFIGTDGPKYYAQATTTGGTTGISPESIYFELGAKYKIRRIDVVTSKKLVSGDILNITVANGQGETLQDWGSSNAFSYANFGDVFTMKVFGEFEAENLIIKPNFVAGNIKIRSITVYGDELER